MERKRKALLALMLYEEMDDIADLLPLLVRTHSDRSDMYKNRRSEGCFDILVRRHLLDNETKFKRFFRVSRDQFFFLVNLIQNDLKTNPTNRDPRPLTAEMKLAVTLRFLATGESLRSLAFSFRIDHSTISKFLPKVLQSLKFGLEGKVLPSSSEIDWSQKAEQFWNRWDFPNCIGALDGKHVRIISPDNSGSLFFNFKGYFSIVLFALVDADCKFTVIDVGSYGKEGDAGIFSRSNLGKLVEQEEIFPPPRALPSSNEKLPHVIIGDEAFRLDKHVLKPYPQKQAACDPKKKNYNYALCRARRVTENAFGLLCVVFRVFFTPINLKPETVDTLVFVCCCLHNLLREEFLIHSPSQGPLELPDHEMPSENLIPLAWKGGFSKSEGFKFYALLENNHIANTTLMYRSVTVFAPANVAFQKFQGKVDDSLVLYHMTNSAQMLSQLGNSVSSELEGNPPLWITRQRDGNKEEIFVNNAKVLVPRSNQVHNNQAGRKQVLHIIDDVLEPVRSTNPDPPVYNPDAWAFLNQSENLDLGSHRVRSFRQRVLLMKKADIFKAEGRYTFFIPVDEGFQPPPRPEKIDEKVIDGHVIPKEVLFTSAVKEDVEHQTLAVTDMLKVTISFKTETSLKGSKTYVKSHTILGDSNHAEGVVLAEIVKANIPVKNGVIHLIHRPLMVVDTTVTQFLESFKDREDGPLYKFYEVIRDTEGDFMERITRMPELTLFAPSNTAWLDSNLNNLVRDKAKIKEILHTHLIERRLTMDQIMAMNSQSVPTLAPRKSLYFNVVTHGHNKTLTVEGGGVNATVIQPDIAATNGIVHIIDRVLGVPFTTVGRKIATDPMLNKTYQLGKTNNFNLQLDDTSKKFTYFVPRDYAWNRMEARYPSAHKKMFMKDFGYHVKQILERHLVVDDKPLTMQLLKKYSNESLTLPTIRDVLKLRVKESDSSYYIEWNNEWIHVFRPDVECTNGVIHVIDSVLLQESDIVVSRAPSATLSLCTTLALFLSILAAHLL